MHALDVLQAILMGGVDCGTTAEHDHGSTLIANKLDQHVYSHFCGAASQSGMSGEDPDVTTKHSNAGRVLDRCR